ncbi:tyrosine-type recombinase/integrase, partial [Blastomonas sp.]|uniref:tyrosine-type recombinase/integrase n=1 Tax=Blastomonas sp. TaxID=1909299 RepID=UPI003593DC5E
MAKLTATGIKAIRSPGRYGDGAGLYLLVTGAGARSWAVRVQKSGKRRDIGLGSAAKVSLAEARVKAAKVRSQVEAGIDPVAERRKAAGIPSFRNAAALVHAEAKAGWRNGKHNKQWLSSLELHAFPAIGDVSVSELDGPMVRDVLAAIWLTRPETARRVRQRIASIVDWATAKGYRAAPLPMATINRALPKQKRSDKHHAAMAFADVPAFMTDLRAKVSVSRLA